MNITQISVFLENRKGQLCEIMQSLADAGVDLRAINIAETTDYGVVRLVADDTEKAADILLEKGYVFSATPVVAVEVPDRPGGLSAVLNQLTEAGIDIEYMYSSFGLSHDKAIMVFKVADTEAAESVLANMD